MPDGCVIIFADAHNNVSPTLSLTTFCFTRQTKSPIYLSYLSLLFTAAERRSFVQKLSGHETGEILLLRGNPQFSRQYSNRLQDHKSN